MRFLAALLAVTLSLALGTTAADARKVLRLTTLLPLKSVLGQNLLQFKDEIEKATHGEIELQIFDSAQLYDDKDVPKAVGAGQIDMGVASLSRYAAEVPAVDVFSIPFLFDSDARLRAAVAPGSAVRGPIDDAIARTGSRVLWWQAYGGTVLLTKGQTPIKSPADLKGRKVRVFSKPLATWVTSNGGTPVNVASGDQYFAYQRGTVDIGLASPDSIKTRKLWEVMDSITVANVASSEFLVSINEKVFQSLSPPERDILLAAAKSAENRLRADFAQLERDALEASRQNKMTIHAPDATDMEAFRKSAAAVRDAFLTSTGDTGRQVLEAAQALR